MNLRLTQPSGASHQRNASMKFTYPSGSRPLEGYTIKRGIGRGGFGEVYYAHSDGGKEVALKHIRRNLEIEVRGVSQCLNLKHNNLLSLYDIRRDGDDDTWVVMEYVGGDSLEEVIVAHPDGLPVAHALEWFRGIAAGVAYLHDQGIVHRDLKPGNVFSDEAGVKIGDYGLSKFISVSRRSGQTESVGTVHYMAPEVANGRYGKEIDIYALGIMLYEMLTGHVPFEGESIGEVLMKHLTAQPDLNRVAQPYRAAIAQALEKDPARRWHSVGEFAAAVTAAQPGPQTAPAFAFAAAPPIPPVPPNHDLKPLVETHWFDPATVAADLVRPEKLFEDDPLWLVVRDSGRQVRDAWNQAQLNLPLRIALLFLIFLAAASTLGIWVAAAVFYGIYLCGRAVYLAVCKPTKVIRPQLPARAVAPPPVVAPLRSAPIAPAIPQTAEHIRRAALPATTYPPRAQREVVTELLGSFLIAATSSAALSVLISLVLQGGETKPEQLVWMALVSTIGSWMILTACKFWEGQSSGDLLLRRLILASLGVAVGLAAYGLDSALMISLPYDPDMVVPAMREHQGLPAGDALGAPLLSNYVSYFALMFIPGWWRVTDPKRKNRLQIWDVAGTVFWAWLASLFFGFPQPWGMFVMGSMSVATQLASPWMDTASQASRKA
jgi:serine/threonine protein kinase